MKNFGNLIWESPTTPPAPKPIAFVLGGGLIVLGLLFLIPVVPMLLNAANDKLDRNGGIVGGLLTLAMIGTGVYVIHNAISALKPKGVQFFDTGVEFGPPKSRRRFSYVELEEIAIEPLESNPQFDKALAGAKLALSIAAMNPRRMGYALNELMAEKVDAFAIIVPPQESELRVAIFGGFDKKIGPAMRQHSRTPTDNKPSREVPTHHGVEKSTRCGTSPRRVALGREVPADHGVGESTWCGRPLRRVAPVGRYDI